MNIQINAANFELTEHLKEAIHEKLALKIDQLIPNFNEEIKTAFLHIEKDKKYKNYTLKFDMTLPGHKNTFYAEACHHDLISAIVDIREAIEKQIKKYKHAD